MIWKTSMWTQRFGVYSCLSHFKLQFILDQIIQWIRDPSKINLWSLWNSYSGQLRGWSKSRRRRQECGENSLCCVEELFELWIQKTLIGRHQWPTSSSLDRQNWMYLETRYLKELDRFDGEQMEFEWENFTGFTTLGILNEIQKMMADLKCEPEQVQGRIIFMSMFNDIVWREKRKWKQLYSEFYECCNTCQKVFIRMQVISGTWLWQKWYGSHVRKPNGEWDRVAEIMTINFAECGHPIFQATGPLARGELKSEGGGEKTIHYNGSEDLCNELDPDYAESEICKSLVIPTWIANTRGHNQHRETCCKIISRNLQNFLKIRNLSKICKDTKFLKKIEKGQFFITIEEGSAIMQTACREYTPTERVDSLKYEDRSSLGCETLSSRRTSWHWYHDRMIV